MTVCHIVEKLYLCLKTISMNKLVVINACVRQADSRTLRIAEPIIGALRNRYEITRYDLPEMEGLVTPALFEWRGGGDEPWTPTHFIR